MKLLTEMQDGCVHSFGCCIDTHDASPMIVATLEHDAAAAHALMQAIQNRIHAAEDRCDNTTILAMNGVLNYADEIMRGNE